MQNCYHCGDVLPKEVVVKFEKEFCCHSCAQVYALLNDLALTDYYQYNSEAGIKPENINSYEFDFLELEEIKKQFVLFENEKLIKTSISLPSIHCSSCIYLLENLPKLNSSVLSCEVNFTQKKATIVFKKELKFSELAKLLCKIGYKPSFETNNKEKSKLDKLFLYQLGFAGFAFGSIMLWSFPEYLGIDESAAFYRNFSSYLSFIVALPVLLFSSKPYLSSAYTSLKNKHINIDVPISLGIIALFFQSSWSIFYENGPGYMDSFAGFIFFLLIGKWFQNYSYQSMSFDNDIRTFFPLAVLKKENSSEILVNINELKVGDVIFLRKDEIAPCNAKLLSEKAQIDYSFITGESEELSLSKNDILYAGGKNTYTKIELKLTEKIDKEKLNQIWKKKENEHFKFQDNIARYFLIIVLLIAVSSGIVWSFSNLNKAVEVFVSVLIVTCPCALALSSPFTYGHIMRVLGRKKCYVKNAHVVEKMASVTSIIFDKTGTLTNEKLQLNFENISCKSDDIAIIYQLVSNSTHPLSQSIGNYLKEHYYSEIYPVVINDYEEIPGKGIKAKCGDVLYLIGNNDLIGVELSEFKTQVLVKKDDKIIAKFIFSSQIRAGLRETFTGLNEFNLHVLSGDNEKDRFLLEQHFGENITVKFNQKPEDKSNYIQHLQDNGERVMMLGDGLNDFKALKQADVGVAVTNNSARFTPSSDLILAGEDLHNLAKYILIAKKAKHILILCFTFSFLYNVFGIYIATSGNLSPLIAAILMPLSSISIVIITSVYSISLKNKY